MNQFFVDGERVDAPEIRDCVLVARIDFCHHGKQVGIDIGVVRDLAFVDFLIRAGFDLASDVGNGRCNEVVTGFAGQELGFEGFVAVVVVVADVDMRIFFERFKRGGVDGSPTSCRY